MDLQIRKFISTRQERGEGYYTHVSQIKPTGKYNLERKDIEDFWKIYCDTFQSNPNFISGLAEKPGDFLPVINDTDIKVVYNPNKHDLKKKLYQDSHVNQTVLIYQKYLKQTIKDYKKKHGICIVLEKEFPTLVDKETLSHGFHLHFIHTTMHKVDQDVHIFPRVKKEIDERKLFLDLELKNPDKLIDKITSKPWLLYGSRKQENLQSYKVTRILDDECNEITLDEALKEFKLLDIHGDEIKFEKNIDYYLPRILSIDPGDKDPVILKPDLNIVTKKLLKKAKDSKRVYDDLPTSEALKKAKILMEHISSTRADNYDDWMDIGWTLYNIGDSCEEALDMWIDFSARTKKKNCFSEKLCMYEWERMEKRNKTIGTLYHYVKQDSPEEYKKIQHRENDRLFNESLNGGHYHMAKWLHNRYRDTFICADADKIWFIYENHGWSADTLGISLRRKISTELVDEYKRLKKKICEEMGGLEDDSENQKKNKTVNKIIANLNSTTFKNNIMKECVELFYVKDFFKKLDSDPYLIRFTNGILDLREMRFRPGRSTDYVSLSTNYDFKEFSNDDMEITELMDHLEKVFPDNVLRQYYLEYCASLLKGGNSAKTYLNFTGGGDNAKSINMVLLKLTLGSYMTILPTSLIFGKRTQSSAATPELDDIQGVRFATLQEPNSKDVINIGILKEITGNDILYVRGLYGKKKEVRPMWKVALICNQLPRLPCDDPASWNRIRVLNHESKFPKEDKDVPESLEEQFRLKIFPRDPFFSEKLPNMKYANMWVMWDTYKRMAKEGRMQEPEKVREATALYRKNNDVFLQFITEKIIEDFENQKAIMSVVETYNSFKSWFNDSYPNLHSQIPSKEEMKDALVMKWGPLNASHKWKGYRLRTAEDDEREGKAIIIREEDLDTSEMQSSISLHKKKETNEDEKEEEKKPFMSEIDKSKISEYSKKLSIEINEDEEIDWEKIDRQIDEEERKTESNKNEDENETDLSILLSRKSSDENEEIRLSTPSLSTKEESDGENEEESEDDEDQKTSNEKKSSTPKEKNEIEESENEEDSENEEESTDDESDYE